MSQAKCRLFGHKRPDRHTQVFETPTASIYQCPRCGSAVKRQPQGVATVRRAAVVKDSFPAPASNF
jgi:hypothetical protein